LNYKVSNQSRNYTGYEHALNIFRTPGDGSLLIANGDNYLFPLVYGRFVERMREDLHLYDRLSIFFKLPGMGRGIGARSLDWEKQRNRTEQQLIKERGSKEVFYAVFGPNAISLPADHILIPEGVLFRATKSRDEQDSSRAAEIWNAYATESFNDSFERDFMNREVCAYFFFGLGKHLILSGRLSQGVKNLQIASRIGYNDELIHSDMAVFLTDHGFFDEARIALEKALVYHEDLSAVYNNWGYYYHRTGDYGKSVLAFQKAVALKPDRPEFYNNLGFALYEAGRKQESLAAFKKSLALYPNQPGIKEFVENRMGDITSTPFRSWSREESVPAAEEKRGICCNSPEPGR
jgi:tetratricopeptide (TPR) repeat protein